MSWCLGGKNVLPCVQPLPPVKSVFPGSKSQHVQRLRSVRRREETVKFGELFFVERMLERADVFTQTLGAAGFGDDDDVVLSQEPGEGRLRRRHAVAAGEVDQLAVPHEPGLLDR